MYYIFISSANVSHYGDSIGLAAKHMLYIQVMRFALDLGVSANEPNKSPT